MKLKVSCIVILAALTGCASTMNLRSENAGVSNPDYQVLLKAKHTIVKGFISNDLTTDISVFVNNELVLQGNLHGDITGVISGQYKGENLQVNCAKNHFFAQTKCEVMLGRKLISESVLKFVP